MCNNNETEWHRIDRITTYPFSIGQKNLAADMVGIREDLLETLKREQKERMKHEEEYAELRVEITTTQTDREHVEDELMLFKREYETEVKELKNNIWNLSEGSIKVGNDVINNLKKKYEVDIKEARECIQKNHLCRERGSSTYCIVMSTEGNILCLKPDCKNKLCPLNEGRC